MMIRNLVDAVAYRLGYVRDIRPQAHVTPATEVHAALKKPSRKNRSAWPPLPEDYGFTSDTKFSATRGEMASERHFSFAEVVDFLDACGLREDEVWLANILTGWPFEIDGATMSFKALP